MIPIYDLSTQDNLGPQLLGGLGNSFLGGMKTGQELLGKSRQLAYDEEKRRILGAVADKWKETGMTPEGLQSAAGEMVRLGELPSAVQTMQIGTSLRQQNREDEFSKTLGGLLNPGGGQSQSGGNSPSLVNSESGGNWKAQNNAVGAGGMVGHFGRLQFGQARLNEAKAAGAMPANATPEDFMASPEMQKSVEAWHWNDIDAKIRENGFDKLIGKNFGGIPITMQGMRNVAHLGGSKGLANFIKSGGGYNPADVNGTTLRDYLAMGARETAKQQGPSILSSPNTYQGGFSQQPQQPQQPQQSQSEIVAGMPIPQGTPDSPNFQYPPNDPFDGRNGNPKLSTTQLGVMLGMAPEKYKDIFKIAYQERLKYNPNEQQKIAAETQKLLQGMRFEAEKQPGEIAQQGATLAETQARTAKTNLENKNLDDPTRSKFLAQRGEDLAAQSKQIFKDANSARSELGTLKTMQQLMKSGSFNSGPVEQQIIRGKALLAQFGIVDNQITAPGEVFQKLSNQLTMEKLGGSLGTAISNTDRDFIVNTVPNLSNSIGGNEKIIEYSLKIAERKQQIAQMATDYMKANGGVLDEKFYNDLNVWANKTENQLVPDDWIKQKPEANAKGGDKSSPPAGAIDFLRKNPNLASDFDAKYGQGSAAKIMGTQ